jgi:dienelactone hydrolase
MCHPDLPQGATAESETSGEEVTIPLGKDAMHAYFAPAAGGDARGAVIVVGDIHGARTPFYEHVARRLAEHGFDAVVPEFFFRVGPLEERTQEAVFGRRARLDERQALLDLDATVSWARTLRPEEDQFVGTLGFCLGGSFVLGLAAMREDLATVCYYGFPAGAPGAPEDPARRAPRPLDEVDRIQGPLLCFWGDRDERVGVKNVEEFTRALEEHGVTFEHTVYPGLDHGFLQSGFEPEAPGHEHAAASWQRTLAFFDQYLGA